MHNDETTQKTRKHRRVIIDKQLKHLEATVAHLRALLLIHGSETTAVTVFDLDQAVGNVRTACDLLGHHVRTINHP